MNCTPTLEIVLLTLVGVIVVTAFSAVVWTSLSDWVDNKINKRMGHFWDAEQFRRLSCRITELESHAKRKKK